MIDDKVYDDDDENVIIITEVCLINVDYLFLGHFVQDYSASSTCERISDAQSNL